MNTLLETKNLTQCKKITKFCRYRVHKELKNILPRAEKMFAIKK